MTDRITADELASMFGETMPISAATLIHNWTGSATELRGRLQQIAAGRLRAEPGLRVRHKKRGTTYEVIGRAEVQTGRPLDDYEVVVVYRSLDGDIDNPNSPMIGDVWVRPIGEFEDGRFEALGMTRQHPDDAAVDRFAAAMKARLAKKRAEGRSGWDDKAACSVWFLSDQLRVQVLQGDPVGVANFAMMIHQRGERIDGGPVTDAHR